MITQYTSDMKPEVMACFDRNLAMKGYTSHDIAEDLDSEICYVAIDDESNEIVGFYLMRWKDIFLNDPDDEFDFINDDLYLKLKAMGKGMEGVALAVDSKCRGKGVGAQLIDLPFTFHPNYVWGMHLKAYNNLGFWTPMKRTLVYADSEVYCTARIA